MTDGAKIAVGLVVTSLVLAGTYVGYREYDRKRVIAEMQDAMGQGGRSIVDTRSAPDPEQVRLEASAARPPDNSLGHRRADPLTVEEQCFNGEIVRQSKVGLLHETRPDGTPAKCKDRVRLP